MGVYIYEKAVEKVDVKWCHVFENFVFLSSVPSSPPEEDKQTKALRILKLFCNNEKFKPHLQSLLGAK